MGSALVERLLSGGHRVVGVDVAAPGFLSEQSLSNSRFSLIQTDITGEFPNSTPSVDGFFHLASRQPSSASLTYDDFYAGNVATTLMALRAAKSLRPSFFLYASTVTIVRPRPGRPYTEDACCIPVNNYGLTKFVAERLCAIELAGTNTKAVVVRFPSLMGKNHHGGVAHTYWEMASKNFDIEVFGEGKQLRNMVEVTDAVSILVKVLENTDRLSGEEVFLAGSRDSLSALDIAEHICELAGSSSKVVPVKKAASRATDVVIDTSKIQKLLGFEPSSLRASLAKYAESMTA